MTSISSLTSSSSTSSSSTSSVSSGIGGLVSGMDTDALVASLTSSSKEQIAKQEQNVQKLEWKQDAYRSVISAMSDFQNNYLDVLSTTNFGSESFFNTVKATSSSTDISVSTSGDSYEGSFKINSITQLATAETIKSSSAVTKDVISTNKSTDIAASIASLSGKSISLTLDGKVKTITIDAAFIATAQDTSPTGGLGNALQNAIDDAFGFTGSSDRVITVSTDSNDYINLTATGSTLKIGAVNKDTATLSALGLTDGQSNKLLTTTAIGSLSTNTAISSVDAFQFSINGTNFQFSKDISLSKMITQINSSNAGVTLSYSSIDDTFTMTADSTGAGDNIVISESSGNIMTALGLTTAGSASVTAGKNAILTVDGQQITRSSNNVTINGVTVKLNKETSSPMTVTTTADNSTLKDSIKKFVEDYNTMIDLVNTYINEESDSDYPPLTDAQKEKMTDSEIEKWEKKAKAGMLRGDSTLRSIASKLQQTMYGSAVKGGISLIDLGITSAGYDENGKLKIDEDKLTKALSTKSSSEIGELFAADTGLSSKIDKVIESAVKTSGAQGSRGTLVEMAGVKDTISATQNSIYKQLTTMGDLIDNLNDRLSAQESRLWSKFTAMETALNSLNAQSSMLTSFSSGS